VTRYEQDLAPGFGNQPSGFYVQRAYSAEVCIFPAKCSLSHIDIADLPPVIPQMMHEWRPSFLFWCMASLLDHLKICAKGGALWG
jgi:hypothetical protein